MSTNCEEFEEIAAVNGAMLLNMGTLNYVDTMVMAAKANARNKNPVVLDPVGCGATAFRRQTIQGFLDECDITVAKGNAGKILSMTGLGGKSRGVGSVDNNEEQLMVNAVKSLAKQNGCVIGLTGPTDYISDGERVFEIENGDSLLPLITGSSCIFSSAVACFTAAAILTVTIASEIAAAREYVNEPGTFHAVLIDKLYNVTNNPKIIKKYVKFRTMQ